MTRFVYLFNIRTCVSYPHELRYTCVEHWPNRMELPSHRPILWTTRSFHFKWPPKIFKYKKKQRTLGARFGVTLTKFFCFSISDNFQLRYSEHRKWSYFKKVPGEALSPGYLWIFLHEKITECCWNSTQWCTKDLNKFTSFEFLKKFIKMWFFFA